MRGVSAAHFSIASNVPRFLRVGSLGLVYCDPELLTITKQDVVANEDCHAAGVRAIFVVADEQTLTWWEDLCICHSAPRQFMWPADEFANQRLGKHRVSHRL